MEREAEEQKNMQMNGAMMMGQGDEEERRPFLRRIFRCDPEPNEQ